MKPSFLIIFICFSSCHYLMADAVTIDPFVPNEIKDYVYQSVSFEDLKSRSRDFVGKEVCITGFVARNFDVVDSKSAPALYEKAFHQPEEANGITKIDISTYYSPGFSKFGLNKRCKIYGVFGGKAYGDTIGELIRVDRVEGEDGRSLINIFQINK